MYNTRKFGQLYQAELNWLTKELLVAKKKDTETFLRSVLQNESRCWTELYKYVKRRTGKSENISAFKDRNGKHITDPIEKTKSRNSYYVSLFSYERNSPQIPKQNQLKSSPLVLRF
jgi:hypothetical protein